MAGNFEHILWPQSEGRDSELGITFPSLTGNEAKKNVHKIYHFH